MSFVKGTTATNKIIKGSDRIMLTMVFSMKKKIRFSLIPPGLVSTSNNARIKPKIVPINKETETIYTVSFNAFKIKSGVTCPIVQLHFLHYDILLFNIVLNLR